MVTVTNGSEAVRCKPKSIFHSTSDAARALKELEGTDSTTDTDAASQCNPSIELITGDKVDEYCDVPPDNLSFQLNPIAMKQLVQTGAKRKCIYLYV